MTKSIAKVAVSAASYRIDRPYDYIIPPHLEGRALVGARVTVPFSRGNRPTEGIILALGETEETEGLKSLSSVLDPQPVLSEDMVRLALWMHERFFCTVYEAVKAMLPVGLWYDINSLCRIADGVDKADAYQAAGRSARQKKLLDVLYSAGGSCDISTLDRAFGQEDHASAIKALSEKGIIVSDFTSVRRAADKTAGYVMLNISGEEAAALAAAKSRSAPSQSAVLQLLADYGGASVRDIRGLTGAALPTLRRLEGDGLITIREMEVFRRPEYSRGQEKGRPELNREQQEAFEGILDLTGQEKASAALLYGVTGSGKTAVYISLIYELLSRGKGCILLVPEIALTPQMLETFSSHFGDNIAVMHSSLSVGERYDEWKRIRRGEARVVIGTRSAVFAPVKDLGLIIIDEEQEESYKSESSPRYHARDVAKFRCAGAGALLLLGSATPNIESSYHARTGRYSYFVLPVRYNRSGLPQVRIVDMKKELRQGNGGSLSGVLAEELESNISRGKQSILFLNRRGTSKLIVCGECGYVYSCGRCSVNLTYHSANHRLMCHYCGHSQKVDACCPQCGGVLNYTGAGTQKVEEELNQLFPGVPVLRMDADAVMRAGSHDALLNSFRREDIPIMVGTQMVAKGLDFPKVTLVGVISADQSLYCGDWRSAERTFSLLTQVIGRSGRGEGEGRAVIQTYTPKNQVILQGAAQDYDGFYASELEMRRLQWCPPFAELFTITATGIEEELVLRCLSRIRADLEKNLSHRADVRVLGPAPLPVAKINNRYRYRLTLACPDSRDIRLLISSILIHYSGEKAYKGVSVFGDINPNS